MTISEELEVRSEELRWKFSYGKFQFNQTRVGVNQTQVGASTLCVLRLASLQSGQEYQDFHCNAALHMTITI